MAVEHGDGHLSLTTNQRPGCLVIAGNTGNVVCNTSFTDLSDSKGELLTPSLPWTTSQEQSGRI